MNSARREKIALVIFIGLILLTTLGAFAYLTVGHNWNVAATSIDDAAGSMDGYTAFVYPGTLVPTEREANSSTSPLTITSVVKSYKEKRASVIRLDTLHPEKYSDGIILKRANKRYGIFSVGETLTVTQAQNMITYFQKAEVDAIIALVPDPDVLIGPKHADLSVGIDILILGKRNPELFDEYKTTNAYITTIPSTGKVGTVLVSPNNIVSSRTLDTL